MNSFTHEELKVLEKKYRLTVKTKPSVLSIPTVDLLDEQQLYTFLVHLKEKIKSANVMVAASLFVKRYSFAILIALYSMSALNKRVDFSINNISVETLEESDVLWLPSFKLDNLVIEEASDLNRLKWRDDILKQVFADHVDLLFTQINRTTKLSKKIMWENLYIYIRWMYQNLLDDSQFSGFHHTIANDFHYILKKATSSLFGSYDQNPFLIYNNSKQHIEQNNQTVLKRTTCCYSYLVGDKDNFCKICPIVRNHKRARIERL
ncbi:iron reductase [Jeotgalibacillus marinus]|uniref:Iron reductase n=1 Tax=Jeotgalibacillus marinus TaxID=86667 RepID=A0ABV3Q5A1_9BACL